jgi:hypothetical protein
VPALAPALFEPLGPVVEEPVLAFELAEPSPLVEPLGPEVEPVLDPVPAFEPDKLPLLDVEAALAQEMNAGAASDTTAAQCRVRAKDALMSLIVSNEATLVPAPMKSVPNDEPRGRRGRTA